VSKPTVTLVRTTHGHAPIRWTVELANGRTYVGTAHTMLGARWKAWRTARRHDS
jgi:hypothetical protein